MGFYIEHNSDVASYDRVKPKSSLQNTVFSVIDNFHCLAVLEGDRITQNYRKRTLVNNPRVATFHIYSIPHLCQIRGIIKNIPYSIGSRPTITIDLDRFEPEYGLITWCLTYMQFPAVDKEARIVANTEEIWPSPEYFHPFFNLFGEVRRRKHDSREVPIGHQFSFVTRTDSNGPALLAASQSLDMNFCCGPELQKRTLYRLDGNITKEGVNVMSHANGLLELFTDKETSLFPGAGML